MSILKTIVDLLEAGGITVREIDTYPPNKETGEADVSMRVIVEEKKYFYKNQYDFVTEKVIAANFFKDCIISDDTGFEYVNDLYNAYSKYVTKHFSDNPRRFDSFKFIHFLLEQHPKAKIKVNLRSENVLRILNVKLKTPPENFNCSDMNCGDCDASGTCPASPENCELGNNNHPCSFCNDDCENCPVKNGVPIKIYEPIEAIKAMINGETLRHEKGKRAKFFTDIFCFIDDLDTPVSTVKDFNGFYSEVSNVQKHD